MGKLNRDDVMNYLKRGYSQLTVGYCMKSWLVLLSMSAICMLAPELSVIWSALLGGLSVIITTIFVVIIKKRAFMITRFVCNTVTYSYAALLLHLIAYRILLRSSPSISFLVFFSFVLLLVFLWLLTLLVLKNIKNGVYSEDTKPTKKVTAAATAGAAVGVSGGGLFWLLLPEACKIPVLLLFFSYFTVFGIIDYTKIVLLIRYFPERKL